MANDDIGAVFRRCVFCPNHKHFSAVLPNCVDLRAAVADIFVFGDRYSVTRGAQGNPIFITDIWGQVIVVYLNVNTLFHGIGTHAQVPIFFGLMRVSFRLLQFLGTLRWPLFWRVDHSRPR